MKKRLRYLVLALVLCVGLITSAFAAGQPGAAGKPVVLETGEDTIAVIDNHDNLWMRGLKDHGKTGAGETRNYEDNTQHYREIPIAELFWLLLRDYPDNFEEGREVVDIWE